MKARSVFACAATGVALMGFGATNAVAEGANNTFEISPNQVHLGDSVSLSATCDYADFTAPAPIESGALVPTDLTGEKGADGVWHLTGKTTVRTDIKPGEWSALFSCGPEGDATVGKFTVVGDAEGAGGTFEISPAQVHRGDSVSLSATCDYPEFTAPAPIESGALVPTNLTGDKGADGVWHLTGKTTVRTDIKPGKWSALFTCGPEGDATVGNFTVIADSKTPPTKAQVPVKPKGPVDTGSLDQAAAPTSDDSALLIGAGAAALLAAGGAGVWFHRRRRNA